MHGRSQFLFLSGIHCSACFALLESSMHCTWPTQHHLFFIVVFNTYCPAVFLAASRQITFSILRQNAVISFNCRSVTVTCCNSTATWLCSRVFTHCWDSHFTLHQLTGKTPVNSVNKVTKRSHRQSYCDKSSVSHLAFSSRLQVASQSYFSPVSHISLHDWHRGLFVLDCVTQCSQSAAFTFGPLRCA